MLLITSNMQAHAEAMLTALQAEDIDTALTEVSKVSPSRTASILSAAPKATLVPFLTGVSNQQAAAIVANFPPEMTVALMRELELPRRVELISSLPPNYVADLLHYTPEEEKQNWLAALNPEFRHQIETLSNFPEGSVGSVMSPYFLAVEQGTSVQDVVEAVRASSPLIERSAYIYVVTSTGQLCGVVSLRELTISSRTKTVNELMVTDVFAARTGDDALEAAQRIRSRRLKMLPVVDDHDVLCGLLSIDHAMDILAHEMADEFVAMNAASPDESFFTPPRQAVRKRLPWMVANVFLNLGAVWVISSFESTIVQVAILAAFLPMITDMGGNVGIQALSVSIRSMALGEAQLGDVWKAIRKETIIGLCNGLALGVLFSVVAFALQGNFMLGVIAGVALGINVLVAGLVGGTMPFLIKRLGQDPAMVTGPVLTTITDITGVTIYLSLSTVFLASLMATGAV